MFPRKLMGLFYVWHQKNKGTLHVVARFTVCIIKFPDKKKDRALP